MKKIYRIVFLLAIFSLTGFSWPFSDLFSTPNYEPFGTSTWLNRQMEILKSQAPNIDTKVLRLSLVAYMKARQRGMDNKQLLTVIDYSKPSSEKRLWVFDLKRGKTLYHTWVSHGKNSGGLNAYSFSNSVGSLKSSIGVFVTTEEPYVGSVGYALRLRGLEPGINDNAYERNVVFHGAWYVNAATIRRYGQVGRSWGCPAVSDDLAKPIINTIKDNTVVVAYYPDRKWLNHSRFLTA